MGAEFAAVRHAAHHVVPPDLLHLEPDDPVVQVQGVSRPDRGGEAGEGDRRAGPVADDAVGRQGERLSRLEMYGFSRQGADPHLGAREVRHDGEPPARLEGGAAQVFDDPLVIFEGAVGKVEAGHVHPGAQHRLHDLRGFGRRADGADEFGFAGGQVHRDTPFSAGASIPPASPAVVRVTVPRPSFPGNGSRITISLGPCRVVWEVVR